jgi:hypothetical protein
MAGINNIPYTPWAQVGSPDFSPLAKLADTYRQGQLRSVLGSVGQELQNGGTLDYQQLAGKLLSAGVPLEQGLSLLQLAQGHKASAEFGRDLGGIFGGGGGVPSTVPTAPVAGAVPSPAPGMAPAKWWSDNEAIEAGLYDPPKPGQRVSVPSGPLPPPPPSNPSAVPPLATNAPTAPVTSSPSMGGVPLANAVPTLIRAMSNPSLPASQKEVAKTLLVKAMDDSKFTDDQKEYIFDQQLGGKFGTWKGDLKRAGATNVNVNTAEKSYDTAVSGALGKRFNEIQENAQNANAKLNTLKYMEGLIDRPGFYSGAGGELVNQARRALSSVNLADPKAATATEVFGSMANQLVLDASGGSLGAQISNADRDFIQRTVPSLGTTIEGNKELIRVSRKMAERQQQVARLARDYAKKNGGRLDDGFQDTLAQWTEANPLFPQSQQPAKAAPAIQDGMTATNPQTGEKRVYRGGQWVKP